MGSSALPIIGTVAGAAIGSVIPGAGTLAGAAIGGSLGGAVGTGISALTSGNPAIPPPPVPPTPPQAANPATAANPSTSMAGSAMRAKAAAAGGMGFSSTITNQGGAGGLIPQTTAASLLG
jgi:hypothetical protein